MSTTTTELHPQTVSSSGEDAIKRTLEVASEETPAPGSDEFIAYYDIGRTVQMLEDGSYKRIALQFPDELLHDSVPVYGALQERLSPQREVYVLADTSYGSCCVDEVAASHVEADVLVHYGHACLSQTSHLPVIYVFGRGCLNVEECVDKVSAYLTENSKDLRDATVLEVRHHYQSESFSTRIDDLVRLLGVVLGNRFRIEYQCLPERTFPASIPALRIQQTDEHPGSQDEAEKNLSSIDVSNSEKRMVLWVGEESTTLTKLLMISSGNKIISYSPRSGIVQEQTYLTNRLLMRRYALVQKARDADVFGILVGTLGVASYLPLIKHLRARLKQAHKKSYTVSVGKINPSKLANFMEIECWIWIACSEGMVDSKEYLRPIISPYELELALQSEPKWTGGYVFDFQELLAKASLEDTSDKDEVGSDQPVFSLVSGTYRQAKKYNNKEQTEAASGADSQELTVRTQDTTLSKLADNAAAHFLQARSYQGLDPRLGRDAPSVLEQGRSGIARGYVDDHRGDPEE